VERKTALSEMVELSWMETRKALVGEGEWSPFVGTLEEVCVVGFVGVVLGGDGGESGYAFVVGDTWDIEGLVACWMNVIGGTGDSEGLRRGGRDEFEVEGVENESVDIFDIVDLNSEEIENVIEKRETNILIEYDVEA
jgi:hypothetical protein